jgi:hypothetical protein
LSNHQFKIDHHVDVDDPSEQDIEVYPLVEETLAAVVVVLKICKAINR